MPWFDCAVRRPISANTGGVISSNLGLVLHHAVANGSLYSFFNNPGAQVSAQFWVARSGLIEQYVDSSVVAWHGKQLNSRYCGVETEGCTSGPQYAEPMPDAMVDALARLYAEGAARHGWVNALANADGQRGFGFHRMAVNTACPCDVRLNRRQDILNKAFGGPITPPTPEPPKREEDQMLLASPFYFNGQHHIFYVTKSHGELWHKWSWNGVDWNSEALMGPTRGSHKNYVETGSKCIEVVSPIPDPQQVILTVYCENNQVYICRQTKDSTDWDRRRV